MIAILLKKITRSRIILFSALSLIGLLNNILFINANSLPRIEQLALSERYFFAGGKSFPDIPTENRHYPQEGMYSISSSPTGGKLVLHPVFSCFGINQVKKVLVHFIRENDAERKVIFKADHTIQNTSEPLPFEATYSIQDSAGLPNIIVNCRSGKIKYGFPVEVPAHVKTGDYRVYIGLMNNQNELITLIPGQGVRSEGGLHDVGVLKIASFVSKMIPAHVSTSPGKYVQLKLRFKASPLDDKFEKVFIHVLDDQGKIISGADHEAPFDTRTWSGLVEYTQNLRIQDNVAPGTYRISIGLATSDGQYKTYKKLLGGPGVKLQSKLVIGHVTVSDQLGFNPSTMISITDYGANSIKNNSQCDFGNLTPGELIQIETLIGSISYSPAATEGVQPPHIRNRVENAYQNSVSRSVDQVLQEEREHLRSGVKCKLLNSISNWYAIQTALDIASRQNKKVYIPEGHFNYYGKLYSHVSVQGAGVQASVLNAVNTFGMTLAMRGVGAIRPDPSKDEYENGKWSLSHLSLRRDSVLSSDTEIWPNNLINYKKNVNESRSGGYRVASNAPSAFKIDHVFIEGGSGGIWITDGMNGYIGHTTVKDSIADSIHLEGTKNAVIEHNQVIHSGDDAIGVISTLVNPFRKKLLPYAENIFIQGNIVEDSRGSAVGLGGVNNVVVKNNYAENIVAVSGIRLGVDSGWGIYGNWNIRNAWIQNNTLVNTGSARHQQASVHAYYYPGECKPSGMEKIQIERNHFIQDSIPGFRRVDALRALDSVFDDNYLNSSPYPSPHEDFVTKSIESNLKDVGFGSEPFANCEIDSVSGLYPDKIHERKINECIQNQIIHANHQLPHTPENVIPSWLANSIIGKEGEFRPTIECRIPSVPSNLTFVNSSNNSLQLKWESEGEQTESFIISITEGDEVPRGKGTDEDIPCKLNDSTKTRIFEVAPDERNFTFTQLKPSTQYAASVCAVGKKFNTSTFVKTKKGRTNP